MRTLITGASGLVGSELVRISLAPPYVTSRSPERVKTQFGNQIAGAVGWDPLREPLVSKSGFDQVINLMGESIAEGRWSAAKKKRIRDSRVLGTRKLVESCRARPQPPRVLVSASAVGHYPSRGDEWQDETSPGGTGYLAEVCQEWEEAALEAEKLGTRVVLIRIGLVMATDGGALKELLPVFRWGGGGVLGNGRQWMPWIHLFDLAQLFYWSAENESIRGAVNGVSPNPITNREFTKSLAKAVNRPAWLFAPRFALRIVLGEFANSLYVSHRICPAKAREYGFSFRFPKWNDALENLLGDTRK